MKVAIYARKSKPPRAWKASFDGESPPTSVESQLRRLRAWAAQAGHVVALEASDTASGGNPNRPGWNRVLNAVRGGHVQAVAITKTDRAMRSTKHYLEVVETMLERSCALEVLDQPMACVRGRGDPMAVAFRTVAAAFAQLERDLAGERSMEVLERADDGRLYGPRSERPAGRPREFGDGHKFRLRDGRRVHDKNRCLACRGETGGPSALLSPMPA